MAHERNMTGWYGKSALSLAIPMLFSLRVSLMRWDSHQ